MAHHWTVRHISSCYKQPAHTFRNPPEKKDKIVAVGLEWEHSVMGIPFQKNGSIMPFANGH